MLKREYIVPFTRDQKRLYKPPNDYPQIKKPIWIKFVNQRLFDAFQVSIFNFSSVTVNRANKEKRASNKLNYRLSRGGYIRLMQDMVSTWLLVYTKLICLK